MFKKGDWVILARLSHPTFYTESGIYSFGRVLYYEDDDFTMYEDDDFIMVEFTHVNRPHDSYEIGTTFRVFKEDLDPLPKLHRLIYGIDTEQETSYDSNKENDV